MKSLVENWSWDNYRCRLVEHDRDANFSHLRFVDDIFLSVTVKVRLERGLRRHDVFLHLQKLELYTETANETLNPWRKELEVLTIELDSLHSSLVQAKHRENELLESIGTEISASNSYWV